MLKNNANTSGMQKNTIKNNFFYTPQTTFTSEVDASTLQGFQGGIYIEGGYTNTIIKDNDLDNVHTPAIGDQGVTSVVERNTGWATENKGATSVADGGTISHGLAATPTVVICTPSTTGEFVSVTAKAASTFTVAIKKHDNTAGTTQTVHWRAFV